MVRARKAHGDKVILDNVTLSFLPGAKIGVVGPNGAGKSTVLQIMAGLQQPSNGDVMLAPDATVGILLQEPPLNDELDVRGNVEEAVKPLRDALTRFEEVSAAMGEPDADFDALLGEQGELMEYIENHDGWELDARIEQAKAGPPQGGGRQGRQAAEAPQGGAGVGPLRRQGRAGQEQGPPAALRGDGGRGRQVPQAGL